MPLLGLLDIILNKILLQFLLLAPVFFCDHSLTPSIPKFNYVLKNRNINLKNDSYYFKNLLMSN